MRAGRRRFIGALAGAMAVVAGGCSAAGSSGPGVAASRDRLATTVLSVVDSNGIPVEDDHVHCAPGRDGRSDTCLAFTSTEPVQRITGRFSSPADAGGPSGGCPGTLTVTIGPSVGYLDSSGPVHQLTTIGADPCR